MQGNVFDEGAFFRDLTKTGIRYLLIGRRALVARPKDAMDIAFLEALRKADR